MSRFTEPLSRSEIIGSLAGAVLLLLVELALHRYVYPALQMQMDFDLGASHSWPYFVGLIAIGCACRLTGLSKRSPKVALAVSVVGCIPLTLSVMWLLK